MKTFRRIVKKLGRFLDNPIRRTIAVAALLLFGIVIAPAAIREVRTDLKPAKLYFTDQSINYALGQSIPVELRIQTSGTSINSMAFDLIFNPNYLEVLSMTTDKSFCTHYISNFFDNQRGLVRIACGTPSPGFQGDSTAVRLQVRAKIPGTPGLVVDPDSLLILANDGKGSNISKEPTEQIFTILPL